MVKETRIVFGLSDVVAVRVTCSRCHKEVVIRPGAGDLGGFSDRCLWCKAHWDVATERLNTLLGMVCDFDRIYSEVLDVKLELDGDEDES